LFEIVVQKTPQTLPAVKHFFSITLHTKSGNKSLQQMMTFLPKTVLKLIIKVDEILISQSKE